MNGTLKIAGCGEDAGLPKVSIVTPSFGHARYIESTLQSVLGQKGDFELEYIVVDGGSTDGTVEILQRYQRDLEDSRLITGTKNVSFRFLSEPDDGQAHAINKGFRQSQGDVLAWLNSDDIYVDAHVIQRVVECFARHSEADIVYGRGYGIDEAGRVIGEENYVTDFDIEILYEIDMVLQPACFWRRDVWDVVGELNQSMHWAFDWEYWMRCYLDHSFHFLDKHLAGNRLHRDTKTETGGIGRKREIAELLLNQGRFTERAVQAYIATPLLHMDEQTDEHAAAATLSPFPVHDYWVSLKGKVRPYLGPTRFLERTLRRYRKRMMRLLLGQSYKKADFSPALKAKVVRRHLIDKEPIAQLSEELGVLPFQVQMWVNQVLTSAESVFGESHQRAHARRA